MSGDFSFITNHAYRSAYEDVFRTITDLDAWKEITADPGSDGFMFSKGGLPSRIMERLKNPLWHSGASFALMLRDMQFIGKNGWDAWICHNILRLLRL